METRYAEKFLTTADFVYKGAAYAGLPLLVDAKCVPITVANRYLLYLVFERGKANSPKTWMAHADALVDYFSYLAANGLRWDDAPRRTPQGKEASNLALYQHWSQRLYRKPDGYPLRTSTINQRVSCVQAFYRWARDVARLIDWLPYTTSLKPVPTGHPTAFAHMRAQRVVESSDLRLPTPKAIPKLLSLEQCRALLGVIEGRTLKWMTRLMLALGLRNAECRTFPHRYVFDPAGLDPTKRIRVELDPRHMDLKGAKPRAVYMSWQTMAGLYQYARFGEGVVRRNLYAASHGVEPPMLFLNHLGQLWSEQGLNRAYEKHYKGFDRRGVWTPPIIDFHVHPHMLRHTFATLELYHEARAIDPKTGRAKGMGHALAWVRDRLGHASIQTTTIYTHCLEALEADELNAYQQEVDRMMAGGHDA